ncbi:aspartate kinase [Streptomyces sp. NPDC050658]|uniref:aspartate kinase n=1 Tax=unclassified Streptomyces TaxID=2593676 RepID=UPI003416E242
MTVIVHKYGGTSLADVPTMRHAARRIIEAKRQGHDVAVTVSAMGGTTDALLALARQASSDPPAREIDALLATGESASAALLASILNDLGHPARSLTGWQAGLITDASHGDAHIVEANVARVWQCLREGTIPVVAGFQGIAGATDDITTLGRGGSDTTAVALAAALDAAQCEIYTDVDGVFTADPRIVVTARRIPHLSYPQMLRAAESGAKVLHSRCIEHARQTRTPVLVRSSFSDGPGTWVTAADGSTQAKVHTVAHRRGQTLITVHMETSPENGAAHIAQVLSDVTMTALTPDPCADAGQTIHVTLPSGEGKRAMAALTAAQSETGIVHLENIDATGVVSIIGTALSPSDAICTLFTSALRNAGAKVHLVTATPNCVSAVCTDSDLPAAVASVHSAFGLDRDLQDVSLKALSLA